MHYFVQYSQLVDEVSPHYELEVSEYFRLIRVTLLLTNKKAVKGLLFDTSLVIDDAVVFIF